MTVLFIFVLYLSNVNAPMILTNEALPATVRYAIPPSMAMGEFSTALACETAGQAFVAKMKAAASPNMMVAGYSCAKKSL